MKTIWVLFAMFSGSPQDIATLQTYEQCVQMQVVCNKNYLGDPCFCTMREVKR